MFAISSETARHTVAKFSRRPVYCVVMHGWVWCR